MKTKVLVVSVIFVVLSINCMAQENVKRFGFEFSGGYSVATNKIGDASLKQGFGFEGIFHYRFMPHTGVYAGWGWNKFASESSFAGKDVDFEETGYVFGLQFKHMIGISPLSYFLRGGGLYNHIEIENSEGTIINDSGHGLGWQLAGGIDVPLGSSWSLTPGVKFNALSRDIDFENVSKQLNHNYFSIRVGILRRL